jgi:uncharacterized protein (TIGR03435 family)
VRCEKFVPAGLGIATLLGLGAAFTITAQRVPTPKFEVVSVKACDPRSMPPGARSGPIAISAGGLRMECLTVGSLITMAYVDYGDRGPAAIMITPVEGGPSWIYSEHYTIDARAASPEAPELIRGPMLRAVLEDRFGAKTHLATREVPVYEIRLAGSGFKLQPAPDDSCIPPPPPFSPPPMGPQEKPRCGQSFLKQTGLDITADLRSMTLGDLADWLLLGLDRLVYDKTGIQGKYDFHLEYSVDETMRRFRLADPDAVAEFPPLRAALEKFGLKLVSAKGPGPFLVIDHVEHPSEN